MATVSKLLLLLVCSYYSLTCYAEDPLSYTIGSIKTEAVCSESKDAVHIVQCKAPSMHMSIPSTSAGATVALHHRRGPCSLSPAKETPPIEDILRSDQLRARSIQRKLSPTNTTGDGGQKREATVPTTLGTTLETLEYVINITIGTPAVTQTVMIDTGSDVSWVHCKPCSPCHSQLDPVFDPRKSRTYSAFSCSSTTCAQLGQGSSGCSRSKCQYIVRYGDGSNTTGTYGSDTLKLGRNAVKGFQFGCSRAAADFDDKTAGLVGLGGDVQSLVSQTKRTFGAAFSYCLPPPRSSAGFLTLGRNTGGGAKFTTTRMFRSSRAPTFYIVQLTGIRVGGKAIAVAPSVFSAGSVMDSGTIITRLPPSAYSAMRSAFRAGMTRYTRAKPLSILDTCYDFSSQTRVSVPAVALVFAGGAVVNLDFDGIMIYGCLAFAANEEGGSSVGVIGNVQQRTFQVLHDVSRSTIGFRAGAC